VGNEVDNKIRFLDGLDLYLTAGYRFDFGLRLEADVLDIQLYVKDRDFSDFFAVSVGVRNIKCAWDIITFHGFTPYIGAGLAGPLGLFYANSNKDFALNVLGLVGASYAVTGNISVHLAYERVFWFDNNGEGVKSSHNGQNLFKLGVMYKF
jgi:opacity protein-like surface antigen